MVLGQHMTVGISRAGTGAIVYCSISVGLVRGQCWTESYQKSWYFGVGTGAEMDCGASVGLALEQL